MIISSNNLIGTSLASLLAVGLVMGAGTLINNSIDKAANRNQKATITASPTSTTTSAVSPTVVPTHKPAVLGTLTPQTVNDPDPIINCDYPHSGTVPVRKSECAGTKVDCAIGQGKWQVVWKKDCDALRIKEKQAIGSKSELKSTPTTTKENLISCYIYNSYSLMTESDCEAAKARDRELEQKFEKENQERNNKFAQEREALRAQQEKEMIELLTNILIRSDEDCLKSINQIDNDYLSWSEIHGWSGAVETQYLKSRGQLVNSCY